MEKYAVIGGQYQSYFYGFAKTLEGAKRLATANIEYWDNWQGWHYPSIYLSEDIEPCNNFYGAGFALKTGALPIAERLYGDKWQVYNG